MVSTFTLTSAASFTPGVLARSPSLTVWLLLLTAMLPLSATNPNTFTSSTPLASSSLPLVPSRSSARLVPVPVATDSAVWPAL